MRSAVPFSRKTVRTAASAAATSSRLASGWVRASAASSPSPSMSKAERAPKWAIRSVICAGHPAWFGQRRSTSPSFWGASFVPHEGQLCGMTKGYSLPSRAATTGATISGITSPAFRKTTRSPIKTPFRATSLALCKVARETWEPATRMRSITPYGVTRPVRPTWTRISRRRVLIYRQRPNAERARSYPSLPESHDH